MENTGFITYSGNTYIRSQNIRVFPCAYRGYYNSTATPPTTLVFDPEARATTEANFTKTFHSLSANKNTYVVAWIPNTGTTTGTLKCVIGGYYFEIYNHSMADFFYTDAGQTKPYYLCITTTPIALGTAEPDASTARTTETLGSFADTTHYLDIKISGTDYAFTGLKLSKNQEGTANLCPFISGTSYIEAGVAKNDQKEDQLYKYYINDQGILTRIESLTANIEEGTQLYIQTLDYIVDPLKLPITNLLDTGEGKYSIRMLEDVTANGTNTTIAKGAYSIALGRSTEATEEASTALGNNTKAASKGAFAIGNTTTALGEGAVALGNDTRAGGKGSIVGGNNSAVEGEGAIALGHEVEASGDGATAFGIATSAIGAGTFAAGNTTSAMAEGAVALGSYTRATKKDQVVIGEYNKTDDTQAFIIANGDTTRSNTANKFTVSYTGDIKALGSIEVNGNQTIGGNQKAAISSTGPAANDLILGTATSGSYGSIKVYGENTTDVFKVENSGNTAIAGTLNVAGATTINDSTCLNNTLRVKKETIIAADQGASQPTTTYLHIGSRFENVAGALAIHGTTADVKVFEVKNDGSTAITGVTSITNTTESGGTTSGALKVAGGVGVQKKLFVGGDTTLKGQLTVADNKATTLTGTLTANGSTSLKGTLEVTGTTTIKNTTSASSTASGALQVEGGAGIKGALYAGTITTTGATALGNTTITGTAAITGDTNITSTTTSTAKDTGALKVTGGVGIGENLNVGGNTSLSGTLTVNDNVTVTPNSNGTVEFKVGSVETQRSGRLYVYGTGDASVFSVEETGSTSIAGKTTITDATPATKDNAALKVSGGITAGNNLYVDGLITATDKIRTKELATTDKLTIGDTNTGVIINGTSHEITGVSSLNLSAALTVGTNLTVGGTISANGQIQGASFNATSDARLKQNIEDYKFKTSITDLPIKCFEYRNDESHTKYIGCLAQDLLKICPELVDKDANGFLSIQETKLVYALLQEVKDLKEIVKALESR